MKAFDKVNHDILLKKVINHRIKGKIGVWIRNFLHDRKYKVVANGAMSEEQNDVRCATGHSTGLPFSS